MKNIFSLTHNPEPLRGSCEVDMSFPPVVTMRQPGATRQKPYGLSIYHHKRLLAGLILLSMMNLQCEPDDGDGCSCMVVREMYPIEGDVVNIKTLEDNMALYMNTSYPSCETDVSVAADDMVRVPESGDTTIGYTGCSFKNLNCLKSDVQAAVIKPFYIDIHEVTYQDSNQAMITDYYSALTICESRGKRLPTEQEWLAAAMQYDIQNYTWGDEYVLGASAKSLLISDSKDSPVMSYSMDKIHGVYDMAGNGCEWVFVEENEKQVECNLYYVSNKYCMGAAPLPLYQQVYPSRTNDTAVNTYASFRCVKDID